jgi:hypothetical protein
VSILRTTGGKRQIGRRLPDKSRQFCFYNGLGLGALGLSLSQRYLYEGILIQFSVPKKFESRRLFSAKNTIKNPADSPFFIGETGKILHGLLFLNRKRERHLRKTTGLKSRPVPGPKKAYIFPSFSLSWPIAWAAITNGERVVRESANPWHQKTTGLETQKFKCHRAPARTTVLKPPAINYASI